MCNEKNSPKWRGVIFLFSLFLTCSLAQAQSSRQLADSARFFAGEKNNALALRYYLMAAESINKDSVLTATALRLNTETGDLLVATGQYAKAEPFYKNACLAAAHIHGKESAEYASACNNIGWVYRLTGQLQLAEDHLLPAKDIREKLYGKENADYATSCNRLAILYADAGMYKEAGPLYFEAKDIRERVFGKDHPDYAMSCNNVAIYYALTGQPHKSEPLYLEALAIRERILGKENSLYAASLNNLAVLYLGMGLYNKAEPLYTEAREIRRRTLGPDHPEYAASCDNLAILYMERGQYEKAEKLYMEGRGIRGRVMGNKHPEYATGCNNLGLLYRMMGQFENARKLIAEARDILGAVYGTEHPEYAKSCNNLGAVYMDMGDWSMAIGLYQEAKNIWAKTIGKDHPEYAKSCNNLALVSRYKGDLNGAATWFKEALDIRTKTSGINHPDYAQSCENLAVIYLEQGKITASLDLQLKAKAVREKVFGKEHPDYVQSCINIANLYRFTNQPAKAGTLFEEAFRIQQSLTKKIFRFTSEKEQAAYVARFAEYRDYFLSYSIPLRGKSNTGYAYDVILAQRNLLLTSSRQLREALNKANDTALLNKYDEWISTREQLTSWYLKPIAERNETFTELEQKALNLEKYLVSASSIFRKEQEETGWKQVRDALNKGEAAVEFATYRYFDGRAWTDSHYYAAIIVKAGIAEPVATRLFESRGLESVLKYKGTSPGQHLVTRLYSEIPGNNKSKSLYDLAWKPLEQWLAGVKTVYFSPSGDLNKVAFSALPVSATERLSDKYQVVQLNSTAKAGNGEGILLEDGDAFALFGGVQYDVDSVTMTQAVSRYKGKDFASRSVSGNRDHIGTLNYLQGSQREIEMINQLARQNAFPVQAATGVNASEESFKDLSGKGSPAVLHVATHGFFFADSRNNNKQANNNGSLFRQSGDPLIRSGLALAGANNAWNGNSIPGIEDGVLTSYEVSNMDLPQTKLAVLSACETGLGDIQGSEGVYGLQRAFKMAGVEYLLMSLWKVPDLETTEFMQLFYEHLFSNKNIQAAYNHAQQVMKTKYPHDPYKWAAWILIR